MIGTQESLSHFLSDYEAGFCENPICSLITEMLKDREITKSELARRADISWPYLHQIMTGKRHPSRDLIIKIGLAFHCTYYDMQKLLWDCRQAALQTSDRRDAVIFYCLLHRIMDIDDVNECLDAAGESELPVRI